MKKVLSLIILMMSCAVAFAQEEEPNDSIQKPSKFASWTISDAFQAEAGFVGSYWKSQVSLPVGLFQMLSRLKQVLSGAIGSLPLTLPLIRRVTIVWLICIIKVGITLLTIKHCRICI